MVEKKFSNVNDKEKVNSLTKQLKEIDKFLREADIDIWARYTGDTEHSVEILLYDKKSYLGQIVYGEEKDLLVEYKASSMRDAVKMLPDVASKYAEQVHQKLIDKDNLLDNVTKKNLINREERLLGIVITLIKEVDLNLFESAERKSNVSLKLKKQVASKQLNDEMLK